MLSQRNFWGAAVALTSVAGFAFFKRYYAASTVFITELQSYYQEHYGEYDLPEEIVSQLAWLAAPTEHLNDEIKRALVRWNCLKLLLDGGEAAYLKFVGQQSHFEFLDFASFRELGKIITNLGPAARAALNASCFMVMSDQTKALAPEVYPISESLTPLTREFLPFAFLKNSNLVQMLYTEGGQNMFAELRHAIKDKTISQEEYDLWFSRWMLEIAALRGQEKPQGSITLDRNIAMSLLTLKLELDQLWGNPEHDVLHNYLKNRAVSLGIKNNSYLVHLGALMGLYHPIEGAQLMHWLGAQRKGLEKNYDEFVKLCKATPQGMRELVEGLRELNCGVEDRVAIFDKIMQKALQVYNVMVEKKMIEVEKPLDLAGLADREFLQSRVIAPYLAGVDFDVEFGVDAEGRAQLASGCLHRVGMALG